MFTYEDYHKLRVQIERKYREDLRAVDRVWEMTKEFFPEVLCSPPKDPVLKRPDTVLLDNERLLQRDSKIRHSKNPETLIFKVEDAILSTDKPVSAFEVVELLRSKYPAFQFHVPTVGATLCTLASLGFIGRLKHPENKWKKVFCRRDLHVTGY